MSHSQRSKANLFGLLLALSGCGVGLAELKEDKTLQLNELIHGSSEKSPGRAFSAMLNAEIGQNIRCKLFYLQGTTSLNINIDDQRAVCDTVPFSGGTDLCCVIRDTGVYTISITPPERGVVGQFALSCFKELLCRRPQTPASAARPAPPPVREEPTQSQQQPPPPPRPRLHQHLPPPARPTVRPELESFTVAEVRGTPVSEVSLDGCSGVLGRRLQQGGRFLIKNGTDTAEGSFKVLEQCDIQVKLEKGASGAIKRHAKVELWP